MAKRLVSMRIDEELVSRAREEVGERGFTKLVERLLREWAENGGVVIPVISEPAIVKQFAEATAPAHSHVWSKRIGESGLVTKTCACGAVG